MPSSLKIFFNGCLNTLQESQEFFFVKANGLRTHANFPILPFLFHVVIPLTDI